MANNNELQKEQKQLESKPKTKTNLQSNYIIIGLAFIFSIAAISYAIYSSHNYQMAQDQFKQDQSSLLTQIDQIRQKQARMQEMADANAANLHQVQNEANSKIANLVNLMQAAQRERHYKNDDWVLLKARYYIEIAQINAHWTNDFNTSAGLLQQADQLLQPLNENKIFDVRQVLAKEIAALKAAPILDVAGILSKLDAAQAHITALSIPVTITTKDTNEKLSVNNDTPGWRTQLQKSLTLIEKLIIIRRNNENSTPILSPLYEGLIKESIRLNIQQAQWAVLNKDPVVYELALQQALNTVKRIFNTSTADALTLIKQLQDLQQISLKQETPIIGLALPLLNQLIDTKSLLNKSAPPTPKKGDKPS